MTKSKSFTLRVRECLEAHGFKVYRVNNGATAGKKRRNVYDKGIPDFIALNGDRVLFVECKKEGDTLKKEQEEFRSMANKTLAYATVCWEKANLQKLSDWIESVK